MEKIQLEISLSDDELKTAMSRYHYEDADFLLFSQVYREIMEQLQPVGMYVYGPFRQEFPEAEEETEENGCQVIVSLGGWPDRLQEKDTSRGMLTESFMAECICTELLLQAYEDMNRKIREKYGLWVKKMLFPGGELPFEAMEKIFRNVGQEEVHYNQCYVLSPKKSVAYLAVLTGNKDEICAGICASCARTDCPNRQIGTGKGTASNMEKERRREPMWPDMSGVPLPYGYQRIFHRNTAEKESVRGKKDE